MHWTRVRGAAFCAGSPSGLVAMLARARGVPLIVGLGTKVGPAWDGAPAILDAVDGRLVLGPGPETDAEYRRMTAEQAARTADEAGYLGRPAQTGSGRPVTVMVNVDRKSTRLNSSH